MILKNNDERSISTTIWTEIMIIEPITLPIKIVAGEVGVTARRARVWSSCSRMIDWALSAPV